MKRLIVLLSIFIMLGALSGCHPPEEPVTLPVQEPTAATASTASGYSEPTESTEPVPSMPPSLFLPEPEDVELVRVADWLPELVQELPYASENNFTGQVIYGFQDAYLRYGTIRKLARVNADLNTRGLALKLWDGFRPVSAQYTLWDACPDPAYVSDPTKGYSSHSRGNTVDVTLVDLEGCELEMPTGFDDFTALADRDYSDCSEAAAKNAQLLQGIMSIHGFTGYFGEWWHFTDTKTYPVEEYFEPLTPHLRYAECQEYISLRTKPDTAAGVIIRIPVAGEFQVLALTGDFLLVDYQGYRGYVLESYTRIWDEA